MPPKQRRVFSFCILAAAAMMTAAALPVSGAENVTPGRELFERRCTGCHSLDRDMEGPHLGGVFGRRSGSLPSFPYSEALKKARIVWNAGTLDRWLTSPEKLVPDTDMAFRVESADERSRIIQYLRGLPKK